MVPPFFMTTKPTNKKLTNSNKQRGNGHFVAPKPWDRKILYEGEKFASSFDPPAGGTPLMLANGWQQQTPTADFHH
jgi:hypothetical protein